MALERLQRAAPVAASQSRTVLSSDADATSLPSGEKATDVDRTREWPSSVCTERRPVAASQSRTVLSSDADATSLPSGEKATELTRPRMALERLQAAPPSPRPRAGPSCRPSADATSLPSGEKATALTAVGMALERLQSGARRGVPEPDRLVVRCRRHPLAVRREGDAGRPASVWPLSGARSGARGRVPEPDRLVRGCGDDACRPARRRRRGPPPYGP